PGKERSKIMSGLELGDGIKVRLNSGQAAFLDRRFIHTRGIVIAYFLVEAARWRFAQRRLLQNAAQKVQVVLIEFAVDAPPYLIGRNRIALLPASAGVLVKIHTGVRGFIHGLDIQAG